MNLKKMSNELLTERLVDLSKRDLALTAEIVAHVHEFIKRRLYLDYGCTSAFGYLTKILGYPSASAQNRLDAARLMTEVPEIQREIATGQINLRQISLLSQGVRQIEKDKPGLKVTPDKKRQILERLKAIKGREDKSAELIANELQIDFTPIEKIRMHRDGSVTIEMTLSKEDYAKLRRIRDINSHRNHNAKLSDVVAAAAEFFLKKRDAIRKKSLVVAPTFYSDPNKSLPTKPLPERCKRIKLSVHVERAIHHRDRSCRWVDPRTEIRCESTFQTQIDHRIELSEGGSNEIENLQLLCGVHNRLKSKHRELLRRASPDHANDDRSNPDPGPA